MKIIFKAIIILCFSSNSWAQTSIQYGMLPPLQQTVATKQPTSFGDSSAINYKKRQWLMGAVSLAGYGGSLLVLNETWYKNYQKTSFHTFNDSREWLQMDKAGHGWAAYNTSRTTTSFWKWAGLPEKKATLIGTASGFAYLSVIELLDAHSDKWGWSWADMGANFAGSSLFAAQQLGWKEQRIQLKFSAHPKRYAADLEERANELFGASLPERLLKDYNTQTYWLSFNLHSFFKQTKFPSWLNVAVGYGAEGMFGGYENLAVGENGSVVFNRQDIKRYRQWYLSPDVDFTKIKTSSKAVRTLLFALNVLKIPAPGLELSNGSLKCNWLQF